LGHAPVCLGYLFKFFFGVRAFDIALALKAVRMPLFGKGAEGFLHLGGLGRGREAEDLVIFIREFFSHNPNEKVSGKSCVLKLELGNEQKSVSQKGVGQKVSCGVFRRCKTNDIRPGRAIQARSGWV
jgi:hypothetical protein